MLRAKMRFAPCANLASSVVVRVHPAEWELLPRSMKMIDTAAHGGFQASSRD
jgi:hypothetical protein